MKITIEVVPTRDVERFSRDEKENCAADDSLVIYPRRATALAHNPDASRVSAILMASFSPGVIKPGRQPDY